MFSFEATMRLRSDHRTLTHITQTKSSKSIPHVLALKRRHRCKDPVLHNCRRSVWGKRALVRSIVVSLSKQAEVQTYKNVHEHPERCTERLLEWDELCIHVGRFAQTSAGKKKCRKLKIAETLREAMELQNETKAVEVLNSKLKVELNFGKVSTRLMQQAIDRCSKEGILSGPELMSISVLITTVKDLRSAILIPFRKKGLYQDLRNVAEPVYGPWSVLSIPLDLKSLIDFAVEDDGKLMDGASAELSNARFQYKAIKNRLEMLIKSYKGKVVERSGKICLALSSKKEVPTSALILDSGSSGMVYCEPRSALSLNNDLAAAFAEMQTAEETILANLSDQAMKVHLELENILHMMIDLDVALARLRYTQWIDASFPQFSFTPSSTDQASNPPNQDFFLSLINLRHPLLMGQSLIYAAANSRRSQKDDYHFDAPIPNDVILTSQTKALVITGPNAGGKTATLKALGLCALMAKAGLGLPAKHPVHIPYYNSVLADIGDEQSLTSSLSTFSGHLRRIQNLRKIADGQCLILLDELGTGTDPKEGAALGAALLRTLVQGGSGGALTTVISTHHALLTTLAYDVDEEKGYSVFENASMEFDDEDLAPTYRLMMGVPGQSNALNIASRLGMDLRIIGDAKRRLGQRHASENILISRIQDEQDGLDRVSSEIEALKKEVKKLELMKMDMEVKNDTLDYQISAQEADVYLEAYHHGSASLKLEKLKKAKSQQLSKNRQIKKEDEEPSSISLETNPIPEMSNASSELENCAKEEEEEGVHVEDWVPQIGDSVYIQDIVKQGTVIKLKSKGQAVIRSGLLTFTVDISSLQPLC